MSYDEDLAARIRELLANGRLRVTAEDVRTKRDLAKWVDRGVGYAHSLPAR